MFICICKGVTDTQIRQAVEKGARSIQCVRRELGVATQCCKCLTEAKEIIVETLSKKTANSANDPQLFIPGREDTSFSSNPSVD